MTDKIDYKNLHKDLYLPKTEPSIVEVPSISFIMVAGQGDPNSEDGEYAQAMEVLYGLSWTIKMSKMGDEQPYGYFEYVIPPLEGLWWIEGYETSGMPIHDKQSFTWIAMIRQPEFVTEGVFAWAKGQLAKKKPALDLAKARFEVFDEGLCAQVMHIGAYDDEPATVRQLARFIHQQGYTEDISGQAEAFPLQRRHHEIYLNDPRRTAPEKLKTVIRHPIKPA